MAPHAMPHAAPENLPTIAGAEYCLCKFATTPSLSNTLSASAWQASTQNEESVQEYWT